MRRLLYPIFLLIVLLTISSLLAYRLFLAPLAPSQPGNLIIVPGSSLTAVAEQLEKTGLIRSAWAFKILARRQAAGGKIQAGTYRFEQIASPGHILQRLIRGDVEKVSLTIPEGFTLQQIITRIGNTGFGQRETLRRLSQDPEFLETLGINADNLEGYLFPETYFFAPGITEKNLLTMMVSQLHRQLSPELIAAAEQLGLNLHQLLTLASIIEKETALVEEMPLISSVFHNRLARRIPLQTDPTVIYGVENFDGNLTRRHLQTPSPYNTYLNRGLPPGPIANPGSAALRAAAYPAQSDYLYFVARGDGSHQFSRTLKEHNAAVRKYQLRHGK